MSRLPKLSTSHVLVSHFDVLNLYILRVDIEYYISNATIFLSKSSVFVDFCKPFRLKNNILCFTFCFDCIFRFFSLLQCSFDTKDVIFSHYDDDDSNPSV